MTAETSKIQPSQTLLFQSHAVGGSDASMSRIKNNALITHSCSEKVLKDITNKYFKILFIF